MELKEALLALEEPAGRIKGGINALGVMTMGLAQARDPYAEGFNVIWSCLVDADQELRKQFALCLKYSPAE